MVRSWLRDDPECALPPGDGRVGRAVVSIDDDGVCGGPLPYSIPIAGVPVDDGDGGVVDDPRQYVEVMQRIRIAYDSSGNPVFEWRPILTGLGLFSSKRYEFDAAAGLTHVTATLMMQYEGSDRVFETAVVRRLSDKSLWRIVGVAHPYGRVEFDLRLIEQEALPGDSADFVDVPW